MIQVQKASDDVFAIRKRPGLEKRLKPFTGLMSPGRLEPILLETARLIPA